MDHCLASACQLAGGAEPLLEAFFGFLGRRTDFYERPEAARAAVDRAFARGAPRIASASTAATNGGRVAAAAGPDGGRPGLTPAASACGPKAAALLAEPRAAPVPAAPNGMDYGLYRWTQTLDAVEVTFPLAARLALRRVNVKLAADEIIVKVDGRVVLGGPLHARIDAGDSTWTVDEHSLDLVLTKAAKDTWWTKLLVADTVAVTDIEPQTVASLADLDPETAQAVTKMLRKQFLEKANDVSGRAGAV